MKWKEKHWGRLIYTSQSRMACLNDLTSTSTTISCCLNISHNLFRYNTSLETFQSHWFKWFYFCLPTPLYSDLSVSLAPCLSINMNEYRNRGLKTTLRQFHNIKVTSSYVLWSTKNLVAKGTQGTRTIVSFIENKLTTFAYLSTLEAVFFNAYRLGYLSTLITKLPLKCVIFPKVPRFTVIIWRTVVI